MANLSMKLLLKMDSPGYTGNIAKRRFVKIGLTLKSLPDTEKSVFGVNLILHPLGNFGMGKFKVYILVNLLKPKSQLIRGI